jgi:hypothetical protein
VYLNVYREVSDAVAYQAQRRGMTLVLRFNGDPVDGSSRESVLRDINKPIVHYTREADITPDVLTDLNRGNVSPPPQPRVGTRTGVGVPSRPAN